MWETMQTFGGTEQSFTIHYKKMVLQYTTLKYITLQILHYTTLHCPTVHYTTNRPFSVFKSDNRVCYNILHYILITTLLKTLYIRVFHKAHFSGK